MNLQCIIYCIVSSRVNDAIPHVIPHRSILRSCFHMNTNIWAQKSIKTVVGSNTVSDRKGTRRPQRLGQPVGSIAMQDDPLTTWASSANSGIGERLRPDRFSNLGGDGAGMWQDTKIDCSAGEMCQKEMCPEG